MPRFHRRDCFLQEGFQLLEVAFIDLRTPPVGISAKHHQELPRLVYVFDGGFEPHQGIGISQERSEANPKPKGPLGARATVPVCVWCS